MWEALSGAIKDAAGDVQLLNAALREHFDRILLENDGRGNIAAEASSPPPRSPEPPSSWATLTLPTSRYRSSC
jgi:hypothetical protein